MLRGILVFSSAILLHSSGAYAQTTRQPTTTTTQSTSPTPSSAGTLADPGIVKFWKTNWLYFLVGFLSVLLPILVWAILGPGRRYYRQRQRRNSVPVLWDRVGNERFQTPSREVRQISRTRGSGSSTRSDLALSSNAAAPGEQDIEATAAIPTQTPQSAYIQRDRLVRSDSSEAVIGLIQPQSLMPPQSPGTGNRSSFGSIGPPNPNIHRAHPRYNSFQRYSRQHKPRHDSLPALNTMLPQRQSLKPPVIPQRKSLPNTAVQRQSVQVNAGLQRMTLPSMQHVRQDSLHSHHSRSTSWNQTNHRQSVESHNTYPTRHASIDEYQSLPEALPKSASTRRSSSRRLQRPQHLHPHYSQQITQSVPAPAPPDQPQMSYYRQPHSQVSQESLRWPLSPSASSDQPVPVYPKSAYPPRSAMSSKTQLVQDRVYGTESGYTYSISAGNPPVKSVKFAAIPSLNSGGSSRFPIRHF